MAREIHCLNIYVFPIWKGVCIAMLLYWSFASVFLMLCWFIKAIKGSIKPTQPAYATTNATTNGGDWGDCCERLSHDWQIVGPSQSTLGFLQVRDPVTWQNHGGTRTGSWFYGRNCHDFASELVIFWHMFLSLLKGRFVYFQHHFLMFNCSTLLFWEEYLMYLNVSACCLYIFFGWVVQSVP